MDERSCYLRHLVSCVEESQDRLPVVHPGEEDHQLDVDGHKLQVERRHVEVDGNVERYLTGVDGGQQLVDMILEVEQVHECIVVETERLDNLSSDRVDVGERLQVDVGELPHNCLDAGLQGLVRQKGRLGLGVATS